MLLNALLRPTCFRVLVRNMSSSSRKLEGKVAIVTASTDGIGYAIAQRLGQDGAKVVVSSRKQKNVDSAVEKLMSQNIDVTGTVCHVGKAEDRKNLFETTVNKYGGVDILVSNAAVNPSFGPILNCTEEAWDKIFDINVKATFLLIKEAVPLMEKRGGGSVVIVSSIGGYDPSAVLGPYSVSKTALLGLVKAFTHQLSLMNIRCNAIAPGVIETRFSETLWKNEEVAGFAKASIPLKRFGKPSECAGMVSFLCSDDASFINGETVLITGGAHARL